MKNLSILVVVLTLTVLGCKIPGIFQREANSNSTSVADTSGTTATESGAASPTSDPKADVVRTSKKFISQSQFSATMDGEGKMPMHIELSYQSPDRFHMISTQPERGIQMETIIIGRDMYMKHGDKWQKLPGALGKTVPQIREFFDEKGLASLTNVTYVGEERVDGRDAYMYSYRNEAGQGLSPHPFTSKIWVRADDGLPAKIEVTYESGDLKTMSINYDYDKTVNIEPPVK
jgi:outer membrane lipoprotein-sorting protein